MIRRVMLIIICIGIILITSGIITLAYTISVSDEIDSYVNKINDLEKEKKQLERDYHYQKREAEYWYNYNVDDAC